MRNYVKSQKGTAMMLALMIVAVLSFLGAGLYVYSVSDTIQVDRNVKSTKAYYIARSGAEAISSYILDNPDGKSEAEMSDFLEELSSAAESDTIALGGGTFKAKVTKVEHSSEMIEYVITSDGVFDGVSKSASLSVNKISTSVSSMTLAFGETVAYSDAPITLKGNVEFFGNVQSGDDINISNDNGESPIKGESTPNKKLQLPAVDFPTLENKRLENNIISEDGYYGDVDVNGTLTFDLSNEENLEVHMSNLTLNGQDKIVIINGNGDRKVSLYIEDDIDCSGQSSINTSPGSRASNLRVYLRPGKTFNATEFKGILYAPEATLTLNGGSTFTGALVVGKFGNNDKITGNTKIVIDESVKSVTYGDISVVQTNSVSFKKGLWK